MSGPIRTACLSLVVIAALGYGASAAAAPAPTLEFKGLALGASAADARRHFRFLRCREDSSVSPVADTVCVDDLQARCHPPQAFRIPAERGHCAERLAALRTFAGTEVSDVRLYFLDGRLLQVNLGFPTSAFEMVVEALTGRYGDPRSSDSTDVLNRFGTRFRDTATHWALPDGRISVNRLSTDFSRGTMSLVTGARRADASAPG